MGQCLRTCEGTFWLEMANSIAILVQIFSILILDQFSQRRKIPLELVHLSKIQAVFYKLLSEVIAL